MTRMPRVTFNDEQKAPMKEPNWRSDRVYGERRGTKRTIKLGGGVTTSVYLDDLTWHRFRRARIASGKSARELVLLANQIPGYNLSDKIRNLLH